MARLFGHLAVDDFLLAFQPDRETSQIIVRFAAVEHDFVDEVGLRRLEAELNGERKTAIRALEELGFRKIVHLRDYVLDMKAVTHDYVLLGINLKVDEEYAGIGG